MALGLGQLIETGECPDSRSNLHGLRSTWIEVPKLADVTARRVVLSPGQYGATMNRSLAIYILDRSKG